MARSERENIRILIVDDEEPGRRVLREFLEKYPSLEIVGECANGFEAIRSSSELRPHLIFLDIQMPKLDGFEVVELLGNSRPAIIFVTAFDQYALRAFEVNAVDYLLKPFDEERFREALSRVFPQIENPELHRQAVEQMISTRKNIAGRVLRERVLVKNGSRIHVIPVPDLDFVEAQDDHILLVAGSLRLRKQETLNHLAESLDPQTFVRIHRSYVLNIERIERLELYAKDSRVAILRTGDRLPVSRAGYSRLRELL